MVIPKKSGHGEGPRIALVHAVSVAMDPIEQAFQRGWPEARRANLLDDTLAADLQRDGGLTPEMSGRIRRLAEHAVASGAQAVLFTCSSFGEAIDAAAASLPVPVWKPNQAMFEAALGLGSRIGMVATFAPAVAPMEQEFHALARQRRPGASIESICVPEAMAAARAGDIAAHNRLVAEAAIQLKGCDAVMLAQFSVAPAREAVQAAVGLPVLSSPDEPVAALRRILGRATEP